MGEELFSKSSSPENRAHRFPYGSAVRVLAGAIATFRCGCNRQYLSLETIDIP